jgi:hypothetical protein
MDPIFWILLVVLGSLAYVAAGLWMFARTRIGRGEAPPRYYHWFKRGDFWLRWATLLVVVAVALILGDVVYSAQAGSYFWHSIAFDDLSVISTAIAAAAACLSAWASKRSRSENSTGLSETESQLIREAMERRAREQMTADEVSELLDTLVRLRKASGTNVLATPTTSQQPSESPEAFEARMRRMIDGEASPDTREISAPPP